MVLVARAVATADGGPSAQITSTSDELFGERRQAIFPSVAIRALDLEVLTLDPTKLSESVHKGTSTTLLRRRRRVRTQDAERIHLARLLPLGGERCREEATRGQRQERAALQQVQSAASGLGRLHGRNPSPITQVG